MLRHAAALTLIASTAAADPAPESDAGHMLELGTQSEQAGKLATAMHWYRKAEERAAIDHVDDVSQAAKDHAHALIGRVPHVTIQIDGPALATVRIDGESIQPDSYRSLEIDAGSHALDVTASGYDTVHRTFEVTDVNGPTLVAKLEAPDPGKGRRRLATYVAIGGGATIVASGVVSYWARKQYDHYATHGMVLDTCTDYKLCEDRANHYQAIARYWGTGLLLAGTAGIATAAVLYYTAPRAHHTVLVPAVGADHAGAALVGSF